VRYVVTVRLVVEAASPDEATINVDDLITGGHGYTIGPVEMHPSDKLALGLYQGNREREKAESLAVHYFETVAKHAGMLWAGDNETEVREMVGHIIRAARGDY
jgi:hypothetical protein